MTAPLIEARRLLQHHFGYADFRSAQVPVIDSVLAGRDTLAVLPTGGGKSICFQVPALVLGGVTIVVSPLIALMQDQVAAAVARGIPAAGLHSSLGREEQDAVWASLRSGELKLLYVSPERLARLAPQLAAAGIRPALLAVDEAHCIAEWGFDFRPSYRLLRTARSRLGRPPVVALTGSATPQVREEIGRSLGFVPGHCAVHLGSFDRSNLWFGVVPTRDERHRLRALLDLLQGDDRMAIVYAPTRNTTEAIARALRDGGHRAAPYHAGLTKERRAVTLGEFLEDRVDVVVATCAFGMGIDKPDIRLVVHWTLPATPEAYYQEAGRAGRDGEPARCVLLWRKGDADLHRRQLDVTFPPSTLLERLWRGGADLRGVPRNILDSAERLRHELRPDRGPVDWGPVRERRRRAEARIAAMEAYARGNACRRRVLVGYFGEQLEHCEGCDRCGQRVRTPPLGPVVAARLARLRAALASRRGPWGGALLEPDILLRLARRPPASAAALAEVPGIGPALAERLGGTILRALGTLPAAAVPSSPQTPLRAALETWRSRAAAQMGVAPYLILADGALETLATAAPQEDASALRLAGLGPRARRKFGADLLRLLRLWRPLDLGLSE
ncbi:MAG TPA: RecQ family ATP-dependent DNA helicase [Gemmatimonadales bacterium]|jgi:ATP-dependent DNA helicase RecQ|nr:RecQ family ATP-dependent DNA helicase [Gemmatimonadales bacterium]